MTRILVISDTHIPQNAKQLPSIIKDEARRSDVCLHCGDFTTYSVYQNLTPLTKTYAVCGNMDDEEIRRHLPQKQILRFENITLALIHGRGHPNNLHSYLKQELAAELPSLHMIVFGHSHNPENSQEGHLIYFNPGSCVDTVCTGARTYGILEIEGTAIERRIVTIE